MLTRVPRRAVLSGALALVAASFAVACKGERASRAPGGTSSAVLGSPKDGPAPAEARSDLAQPTVATAGAALGAGARDAEQSTGTLPPTSIRSIADAAMIIHTGTATVQVDSLDAAVTRLRFLALSNGGYVADVTVQGGREQLRSATIELRVPSARFDNVVTGLAPIGRVESVNVTAQDVSEEYVDLSARAANARHLEERLITLLATRTGKLQDVLEVEREIARVREEIERYEGRMRFLRERAAVSSLSVTVHEPAPLVGEYRSSRVLADAVRDAWRNFVGVLAGLIAMLGWLVPLALVLAAVAVAILRALRRERREPPRAQPPAEPPAERRAA